MSSKVLDIVIKPFIEALEEGKLVWRKSWVSYMPYNPTKKDVEQNYSGFNLLKLMFLSPYSDPRWATMKQWNKLGVKVNKGEGKNSFTLLRPNFGYYTKKEEDKNGKEVKTTSKYIKSFSFYTVYNIKQTDHSNEPLPVNNTKNNQKIETVESLLVGWQCEHGNEKAFYRPTPDTIHMPDMDRFTTNEAYYSVRFHEMIHATGHTTRLNRFLENNDLYSDHSYDFEELVAEIGASILYSQFGFDNSLLENSKAYVQGWATHLKDDPQLLVKAGTKALEAVEYIKNNPMRKN